MIHYGIWQEFSLEVLTNSFRYSSLSWWIIQHSMTFLMFRQSWIIVLLYCYREKSQLQSRHKLNMNTSSIFTFVSSKTGQSNRYSSFTSSLLSHKRFIHLLTIGNDDDAVEPNTVVRSSWIVFTSTPKKLEFQFSTDEIHFPLFWKMFF